MHQGVKEEEGGVVGEDMMGAIVQGMTAGGGPAAVMNSMLRTFLGPRPPRAEGEGATPPPSGQTPSSREREGAGTGDRPTPGEGQGEGPPPGVRQVRKWSTILRGLEVDDL